MIKCAVAGSIIVSLGLLVAACTAATEPQSTAAIDTIEEIESSGLAREYRLHIPASYHPDTPVPLVINLHGFGSNAAAQEAISGMSAKADEAGFIAVHPEGQHLGSQQGWFVSGDARSDVDVQFIRDLVTHLQTRFSIDTTRIYASGLSNGGGMANRLACDAADLIAAFAPVSGANLVTERCQPGEPVTAIGFHGTADPVVPYAGKEPNLSPVRQWATDWANRNGCTEETTRDVLQSELFRETWENCRGNVVVILHTVEGGLHTWPGGAARRISDADRAVAATDIIWAFFAAHPKASF